MYAADRSEALVCVAQLATGMSLTPAPLRLPGLLAERTYRVTPSALPDGGAPRMRRAPRWWPEGISLTGRQLAVHGLQLPTLNPETAVLLHLT